MERTCGSRLLKLLKRVGDTEKEARSQIQMLTESNIIKDMKADRWIYGRLDFPQAI